MATDPLLGTTVGGCDILEVIGQGGMGVIYKARQKSLDRVVALKVLARHLASDINFVARFQKEARAIARVNHPNILGVYDVGDDQNTNYMIMELIEGQSLAELQSERRGAIPWEEATEYIRQAAAGLEAAQSVGIIHRDIKPENLMVTKKYVIKVSDFGLAKEADSGNTSIDAVMGTPAFMSPEQCDGKKVDGRSDIYSLGGTFYRLVSGRLPFEAETAMSMMYRHKHEALIPPHEVVSTVPQSISAVIVKMMAKKREQRYQTMTEVIDALETARRQGTPAIAAPPAVQPPVMQDPPVPQGSMGYSPPLPSPDDDDRGMGMGLGMGIPEDRPAAAPNVRPVPVSGRLGVPAGNFGAGPGADSSVINMPTNVLGMTATSLSTPDTGYTAASQGEEMIARGDRVNGLKQYRIALQSQSLDNATRQRLETEIRKEIATRKTAAESLIKRGMLVEASRDCRVLMELDPNDEVSKAMLKDLETKLSLKRTMVNDIRTAIASSAFDKAIKIWDSTAPEIRDESVGKQIDQLKNVIVPSTKLAEQGEHLIEQGRLEEAISSFEDAIKLNPACEPARMGLKDAEQKRQRIEFMLKEGFQHSLEQNYEKAVETWKPILELRPGHPQAVKGIVDAAMAHAQNLRAHGDLEGALASYRDAAECDPENRALRRSLDELTNLRDKEQALIDRAQEAAARGRLGEAVGYWKEVQRINPTSKRAQQQVSTLRQQRSSGLAKTFIIITVLAIGGGAGYQFFMENKALSEAREMLKSQSFSQAADLLRQQRMVFNSAEGKNLLEEAQLEIEIDAARKIEQSGKLDQAADAYARLEQKLGENNKPRALEMQSRAQVCLADMHMNSGNEALTSRQWQKARDEFNEVKYVAERAKVPGKEIEARKAMAERTLNLVDIVANAERISDQARKREEGLKALKLAQELKAQGSKAAENIVPHVERMLKDMQLDIPKYEAAMAAGKEALRKLDLQAARAAFKEATVHYHGNPAIQMFETYTDDLASCIKGQNGEMVLYSTSNPLKNQRWGNDERSSAFCVDKYEWPNKSGATPLEGLSFLEAKNLCVTAGKTLCTKRQYVSACKGDNLANLFPYGQAPDPAACNTEGSGVMASGAKTGCKNALGIYDMSGNLAEWVDTDDERTFVMGGSYGTPTRNADCESTEPYARDTKGEKKIGFRCCRALNTQ